MSATSDSSDTRDGAERREEIRDQLLVAMAAVLAAGEGDGELIIDRLVAEAGIGRSTFYKYFKDKGDLFRAWLELIGERLAGAGEAWLSLGPEPTREELSGALEEMISNYRPHAALMATLYDVARYDAALAEAVDDVERRSAAALARHIETGQRDGWIDPVLLCQETAAWLTWLGERGRHQLLRVAHRDDEVARLLSAYVEIVWSTLYAFAPARSAAV